MNYTTNPAFPHPDQDPDTIPPPTLAEAIEYARKVLLDEKAEMYIRRRAAGDLIWALECSEE